MAENIKKTSVKTQDNLGIKVHERFIEDQKILKETKFLKELEKFTTTTITESVQPFSKDAIEELLGSINKYVREATIDSPIEQSGVVFKFSVLKKIDKEEVSRLKKQIETFKKTKDSKKISDFFDDLENIIKDFDHAFKNIRKYQKG